jgi:uncharacterized membrane-anchored protein
MLHGMLIYAIPVIWLLVSTLVLTSCRMAARADRRAPARRRAQARQRGLTGTSSGALATGAGSTLHHVSSRARSSATPTNG